MTDDETNGTSGVIYLDQYLDPALSYAVVDDRAVLVESNDPFDDCFGTFSPETPLSTVFDEVKIVARDPSVAFPDCLLNDEGCTVRIDPTDATRTPSRYLARVIPPRNGSIGNMLFVETIDKHATLEVDRVASVISHDLRNPLDVAKARLRAGRETGNDEHFEHVARAHDRMERIIEDVLTLARSEDVIDPTSTIDLETVAETAWETVQTADAELTFDDSLPAIVADRDRVGRLFENVFRNAVEHGSEQPQVTVGTVGSDGFYIADDGPGIAEQHRESIFEPGFSVADNGTGLGLAIVERIVTAHDWSITVTDSEDGGARFEITGIETLE